MVLLMGCFLAACAQNAILEELYRPKFEKQGLELLYSLDANDVDQYFPLGTPREVLVQRYGNPPSSGTKALEKGGAGTYINYMHSRVYSHYSRAGEMSMVIFSANVMLGFDASGRLIDHSFSTNSTAQNSNAAGQSTSRVPSDAEIVQYLGARPPLPVAMKPAKAGAAASSGSEVAAPLADSTAQVWKLGMRVSPPTVAELAAAKLKSKTGVVVRAVAGSSAKAGLQLGDVIVKLNGNEIAGLADMSEQIKAIPLSSELVFQIVRKGAQRQIKVPPQELTGKTVTL